MSRQKINGCDVIWDKEGVAIIEHPHTGYQVYDGFRIGTRKSWKGALSLAEKRVKLDAERVDEQAKRLDP